MYNKRTNTLIYIIVRQDGTEAVMVRTGRPL